MAVYPERRSGKLTGWFYGQTVHKGKRFRERFETMAEAQGYVDHVNVLGYAPGKDQTVSGPTFAQVAQEAQREHPEWKRGRDTSLVQRLTHVVGLIGGVAITAVDRSTLQKIVTDLQGRPGRAKGSKIAGSTINRYLATASAVLTFAEQKAYRGPAPSVPWQLEDGARLHWFTNEMEDAIVGWLEGQGKTVNALLVRVLAATGMRAGELYSLEPAQIEDEWIRLWKTKTDSPRSVPIGLDQAKALRAVVASGTLTNAFQLRRDLKAACKACGYPEALTVHSLRHSTATRILEETGDLALAQEFLGHRSLNTTRRYAHISSDRLQDVAKKLSHGRGKQEEKPTVVDFASARKQA